METAQVTIANNFLMDVNYVLEKDSVRRYVYFFSQCIKGLWRETDKTITHLWCGKRSLRHSPVGLGFNWWGRFSYCQDLRQLYECSEGEMQNVAHDTPFSFLHISAFIF